MRKQCQKRDGKLKKGWKYGKNGRCVKAKSKAGKSRASSSYQTPLRSHWYKDNMILGSWGPGGFRIVPSASTMNRYALTRALRNLR